MAAYFFSSPIDIDIKLSDEEARKHVDMKSDKDKDKVVSCPVYYDGEGVGGTVSIRVRDGKKITHDGIKVEFVGTIGVLRAFSGQPLRLTARRRAVL